MPIKLKSTGGGSVTLDVPSTGTDYTLYMPANNATLISSNTASLSNTTLTGNTSISGSSSYLSINGINVSPYSGMMKNRVINGSMAIDQRFAGAANNNTATGQYNIDRWFSYGTAAAKLRFQQNNTNGPGSSATQTATGFPNYFGANTFSSNTVNAGDAWLFGQFIEGFNTSDLGWGTANASPITLSFWVYSSIAGTHAGSLRNNDSSRSYPFTYSINTANTWQYQTVTISGDTTGSWLTNNSVGISLTFSLGTGSTYSSTPNSWGAGNILSATGAVNIVSAANGAFYLTGVQLEKGSQATAFEFRHYTTELSLCQRYYYKEIPSAVNTYFGGCGLFYNTTSLLVLRVYPVTMRAIPTFFQSGTASHYGIQYGGGSQTCNAVPGLNGGSIDSSWVTFYGTSFTTGQAGFGFNTGANQGYLAFSAEIGYQN